MQIPFEKVLKSPALQVAHVYPENSLLSFVNSPFLSSFICILSED